MLRRLKGLLAAILAAGPGVPVHATPPHKPDAATKQDVNRIRLAFVLLQEPVMPAAKTMLAAFERIAPAGKVPPLRLAPGESGSSADAIVFDLGDEGRLMVGLVPTPVPKQEAEWHAERSLASARTGWKLPSHRAHLIVMWQQSAQLPPVDGLKHYTWLLAAVADAAKGLAVYWADSGATHPAEYFVGVARGADSPLLVTLWSGLSVASDGGDPQRMSLVSLGMSQLDLPDLELTVPRSTDKGEALDLFYQFLNYTITRGSAIPEGDTVGRSPDERLKVRYARSPVDPKKMVWRVDLPGK
jgi:hypothetical protein